MKRRSDLLMAAAVVAMTVFVTWPQALYMSTRVAAHQDPAFSIWRLAWVAHALATGPRHLLDGNIFYPMPNTLTYSDAMPLEAALAAPLFWLRVPPILIYNIMLLVGLAASGFAAFVLARELTSRTAPALFAAMVFTMAPYRIEHFMHLELQWAMWIPLTFWAFHRTLRTGAVKDGAMTGVFLALQVASCVYYGVFLAIALAVFAAAQLFVNRRALAAALPPLALGAAAAAALTAPYLWVYMRTAHDLGARETHEIAAYGAMMSSYLHAPDQNWLRGSTAGSPELNLFIGWTAMTMAVIGAAIGASRQRAAYTAVTLAAVVLSLGLNTRVYPALLALVPTLAGLRAPARFAIVANCGVAVLAALGIAAVRARFTGGRNRWGWAVVAALFAMCIAEYANTGMNLTGLPTLDSSLYRQIRKAGPGVVLELPVPRADALPGDEAEYEYWSLSHWHPLVNGYSGYYPRNYIESLDRLLRFPDQDAIDLLRMLDVRYIVVHAAFVPPARLGPLLVRIGERADMEPYGRYTDGRGDAYLFELLAPK